ncbi:MAG: radical SAM family heme chaperone HemW [Ferruginibacter sp.]|nr:radical SAM family heme chaperone HemW [Ferruginibacter sp.]
MAGIYIHIPFCRQACTYCNFHFSTALAQKDNLLAAIVKEIIIANNFIASGETIDSIYFGGGTPSLLTKDELMLIIDALHATFQISKNAEITLEANPDDINKKILDDWLAIGINRLSLGVQSFNEAELRWMNRAHTARESLQSIDEIIASGLNNFSVDLIFGSPLLTDADLEKNLDIISGKNIPHLSCYALTVEPKTLLNKLVIEKKSLPVNEDTQARQFSLVMNALKQNGYDHYEISNYAKPGMRSKHNSSYWQGKPYYGFGPSAHSFNGTDRRRWNIDNNSLYIQSLNRNKLPFQEEVLTETQQVNEYLMTALRTMEGINKSYVEKLFGVERFKKIVAASRKYIDTDKVAERDGNLILTDEGKLFADGIAADLFF